MKNVLIVLIIFTYQLSFGQNEQSLDSLLNKVDELSDTDLVNASLLADTIILISEGKEEFRNKKAEAFVSLSKINHKLGNYAEALDHTLSAQILFKELSDSIGIAHSYGIAGLVYKSIKDYEEALKMYDSGLFYLPKYDNSKIKAGLLNNKGVVYMRLKDFDKAKLFYSESLILKKELKEHKAVSNTITNLAIIAAREHKSKEAIKLFHEAYELDLQNNDQESIARSINNLANIYLEAGEIDKSIDYASRGLEIAEEIQAKLPIKLASQMLHAAYQEKGNFKKALEFHEKYMSAQNSLFNEKEAKKIGRLQAKLDLIEKEKTISALEKENHITKLELSKKKQQQILLSIIASLIIVFAAFFIISQKQKSKLKVRTLNAEITELRLKIQKQISELEDLIDLPLNQLNVKINNPISEREFDILQLIPTQKSNREIGEELFISTNTVKFHLKNIYVKLGVSNREEALKKVLASK